MIRHHCRREPRTRSNRFSWFRLWSEESGQVTYRLFRRDEARKVHMSQLTFTAAESRMDIAAAVRRHRNTLRDRVDALDFESLGVAA